MTLSWTQSQTEISFSLQMSFSIKKEKINIFNTETYIRINISDPKLIKLIDFYELTIPSSIKVIISNNILQITLKKSVHSNWSSLEIRNKTKIELETRRNEGDLKRNIELKEIDDVSEKKKKEIKNFVIDKSIQIGNELRNEISKVKDEEKNKAISDVYDFIDNYNENSENIQKEKDDIFQSTTSFQNEQSSNKDTSSILDNSISAKQRQPSKFDVSLTKKMIPHFATRESMTKEPPYPKSKKYNPEKDHLGMEIDERNPIWIKDKADNSFKNKDYPSAISLYNKALLIDADFHKAQLNRSTCFLLNGEYDESERDLLNLYEKINCPTFKTPSEDDAFYSKLRIMINMKLYAVQSILGKFTEAIERFDILIENYKFVQPELVEKIEKDRIFIIIRKIQSEYIEKYKIEFENMINYLKNEGDDKMKGIYFEYIHDDKNYITYEIVKDIKNKMGSTIMSSSELEINIINEYLKISELEIEERRNLESNNDSFIEYKNLYKKIISLLRLNKNEKILSNLSLLYSIINNNDISVKINNEISSLLSMFNNKLKPTREIYLLEIKNILRRAKSYHLLNNIDKAQEDIVKCERLLAIQKVGSCDEYNQITNSIVRIKDDIKSSLLNEFVQKANQLLIEKKFADALELYNKAINMNKLFKSQLENCKFLINRSTCFISLLQYSIAVIELSKVLNILNRHRNIAIINKENQIVFDEIKNLEFLCYVRRGAAYSFEKNYEFAIKDYSNALEIRKDVKIEENLKVIKKLVGN